MKSYKFGNGYEVNCWSENTRYGFRHLCELTHNLNRIGKSKACYYNRTWEAYEFQSVIHQAIQAVFDNRTRAQQKKGQEINPLIKQYCDEVDARARGIEAKRFDPVKMAVAFGALLTDNPEERANWDKRMLSTVPGIDFPDDFDSLPVEEQQKRLDKAKEVL
ncbi:MAG: hypothetical protein WC455_31055 [Dehalococcoidia bacterium]|jgi:hypothetical protein